MFNRRTRGKYSWVAAFAVAGVLYPLSALLPGCGGTTTSGGDTSDTDGTAANYKGIVSGSLSDSRSTRESFAADDESAAQVLPASFDEGEAEVVFEDLSGDPLLDQDENAFPPVPVDSSGSFEINELPVGIDFVIAIDLDGDGEPDISQVVQIPVNEAGDGGQIDDVMVDPLTTLIVARLREMLHEQGINPDELDISPTAIVQRVVEAYTHLFEEAGIDQAITVEDIGELSREDVKDLFEEIIPPAVRAGMDTVEGNLALGNAGEIEEAVRAVAEVFLRAGFPIADDPGGIDLSFLGELPDVEIMSMEMIAPPDEMVIEVAQYNESDLEEVLGDGALDDLLGDYLGEDDWPDEYPEDFTGFEGGDFFDPFDPGFEGEQPVVFVSMVREPDRNFVGSDEFKGEEDMPPLPILNEHLLARMAKLHLEGRVITLGDLYRLLTDSDLGLGVRLTYMAPMAGPGGPPLMVFESADGQGVTRDVEAAIFELLQNGLMDPEASFEEMLANQEQVRGTARNLLKGTIPPAFKRLFGAILSERVESVTQLLDFIRNARIHLPFSRSGPATFYVVADGDPFRPDAGAVNPASVDVEFGPDGWPIRVTYNAAHSGHYFLGFTHKTETNNLVELLVRETGRWLHGPHGEPIMLDMGNPDLFESVNGKPFADFVSEQGTFWPGVPVSVGNPEYRMDDPAASGFDGPTMQLFVLADAPGPEGIPVIVDYDIGTGTFSSNPNGRYYLMFLPETHAEGVFGLYDIEMGFMASVQDLTGNFFVELPPPPPDDTYQPPPDGDMPPDGENPPPPDGEVPPEGEQPPPPEDGTETPADEPPPEPAETTDGSVPEGEPLDEAIAPPPEDDVASEGDVPPPPEGDVPPPEPGPMPMFEPARVMSAEVIGLYIEPEYFRFVYGSEVPNENYDPSGNPFFDDANGNGIEDMGEYTADHRPCLFNPDDWRSTDISRYYRRASGGAVTMEDVDFESDSPRTHDGEALVPRNLLPRLNAFKFGRPNSAVNLLTTFLPPGFFDGTKAIDENTELSVFQAVATINMVMEQNFNVEAVIDFDGDGPFPAERMVIDAHLFVMPIGDPFILLIDGFESLSTPLEER